MKGNKGQGLSMKVIIIAIAALLALVIVSFLVIKGTDKAEESKTCCETICGQFNQECRGWNQDTLECTFNYGQYGYPWVEEVFTFTIDADVKDLACNQGILPGTEEEVTNNATA